MKKNLLVFSLFIIINVLWIEAKGQRIYLTDSSMNADVRVYVTNDTLQADLYVCVVDSLQKVNKDGHWYYVPQEHMARLKVKISDNPYKCDLVIYYVSDPKKAGWINTNKRFLYRKRILN